ncbi:LOW QUALITY PROTEIN: collagen alpha-2(I) chain [Manduca sexta]|uniref:LOW QUALITY PROTEIN: collagen alpha-2(I) chain n=1 Tax=Manduca sexta TaxID=7130 RepID=UPI00188DF711|nr:LOW QUALITY PROTEIN: collagen alpha-2(I) chain [Manduca sexta]
MELKCAHIFLLFSVVSATPHGYGTKGGASASAKAEAIATAGAFDGVRGLPLSIPSGPGYSGSFSKSSSSSFSSASSSASSSSSSFSYSGSGSSGLHGFGANSVAGANAFGGENGPAGSKGIAGSHGQAGANAFAVSNAQAGTNGLGGSNGLAGPHGLTGSNGLAGAHGLAGSNGLAEAHGLAGSNGLAGANGLAGSNGLAGTHGLAGSNGLAGAHGVAGSNGLAEGNDLAGTSGCGSGACSHNKVDGIPSHSGSSGATTGQGNFGSNAAGTSNAESGTYGFTNGGGKTCIGSDCSHHLTGCEGSDCLNSNRNNKCTSGHCGSDSLKNDKDCSSGNCEITPSQSSSLDYPSPTQCTSGQCGLNVQTNLPTTTTSGSYDIPAKKHDFALKPNSKDHYTHNAFSGYNEASSNSNTQSSHGIDSQHHSGNVDVHGQLHGIPTAATSSTGNSGLSIDHSKPATYLTTPKVEEPCNTPSCKSDFGQSAVKPTSYNVPLHTSIDGLNQNLPCKNGNCGINQYPTPSVGPLSPRPAGPTGCSSPNCAELTSISSASDCKSPHCAPNYPSVPQGSASGINYPADVSGSGLVPKNPSYASPILPSYNPSHGYFKPGCKTPDCTEYTPGHVNAGANSEFPSHSGFLPAGTSPTIPSYSTPILLPNTPTTGHSPNTPNNAGNYGVVSGTTAVTPGHIPPAGGFGGPSGILKPNEFSLPSNTHVAPSFTKPTIPTNPIIGASPSAEELPPYTGGFGGPHGVLKPNEFDIKHPSTTHNTPISNGSPAGHDLPTYTGGFGAPTGLLKPNEISSSANAGASANSNGGSLHTVSPNIGGTYPTQQIPTSHGSHIIPSGTLRPGIGSNVGIPAAHLTTPVVLQPIPVIHSTHHPLPVPTQGFVTPTGSVQPSAYYSTKPTGSSVTAFGNIDSHGHLGHTQLPNGDSNLNKDLPKYTGNFGGATGVLKSNDFKDSLSHGYNKPGTTSSSIPVSCSPGTCNSESINSAAAANAEAVAYAGGFGGPPGLLKPHDGGKLDHKLLSGAQFGLHQGSSGSTNFGIASSGTVNGEAKTPAHDTHSQSGAAAQANAVAQASATAEAASGSFGGSSGQAGVHGDDHKSGSGCGGGCGGGSYHGSGHDFGSSSAISSAKAGVVNGPDSGLHGNSASAKSLSSAVSGARAFGGAGSYASSSASAHASAGYATKGGYGK